MATHPSILAWRIPWTERSLAGCSLQGRKESDTTKELSTCVCMPMMQVRKLRIYKERLNDFIEIMEILD